MTDAAGRRPLRAYVVTHYAITAINNTVAARTAKEALQKDEDGDYLDEGWAGEAFPTRKRPKARRCPFLDAIAAASEEKP
jgi:hypothetical protein